MVTSYEKGTYISTKKLLALLKTQVYGLSKDKSSCEQKQKPEKINLIKKLRELLSLHSKYVVSAGLIVVACSVAGFNVHAKNNPELLNDSSILLGLLTNEQDYVETVYSNFDNIKDTDKTERFSMKSIASASAAAPGSLTASLNGGVKKTTSEQLAITGNNTLIKSSPTDTASAKTRYEVMTYIVREGDTITGIAKNFGVDAATILTASNKYADDIIKPGDELTILPISGALENVDSGETLSGIAKKHSVEIDKIMEYNDLINASDIVIGDSLIIPDGNREIQTRPIPEVTPTRNQLASNTSSTTTRATATTSSYSQPVVNRGPSVGNRFQWGWCTWYAAERRGDVTWRGNAGQWLVNAKAQGRATGRIPAVGAIMVTSESWWGHVAIVEAVNGNSVTVSEMNYKGFGITSSRVVSNNSPVIKGYIY